MKGKADVDVVLADSTKARSELVAELQKVKDDLGEVKNARDDADLERTRLSGGVGRVDTEEWRTL